MKSACRLGIALGALAAMSGVAVQSLADDYQFIDPSTYPAENVSYPAYSPGASFETSTRRVPSGGGCVESRNRTQAVSAGCSIRSDKFYATMIILF